MQTFFTYCLYIMPLLAVMVFITLYFVEAGYGISFDKKWGWALPNKLGWFLMELPSFAVIFAFGIMAPKQPSIVPYIFLLLFELHYFHRVFIFPFLMKGKNQMPVTIIGTGIIFNILNAFLQGYWIFFAAPANLYTADWLSTPQFIIGTLIFFTGMFINLQSDYIIRHLRKTPEDTHHYLPQKGMFQYVTSANYFGELTEWLGFAILTWSLPGLIFFIWTFANLVPRAHKIHQHYQKEFGEEMSKLHQKRVFPFIY